MDERQQRRIFQWVKTLSNEKFWAFQNWLHSRAYAAAVQHYMEAAEIVLPPRLQKQLHEKAAEIREQWDGMRAVTLEGTGR
jgi:DnaJ-domain-containing protein 1